MGAAEAPAAGRPRPAWAARWRWLAGLATVSASASAAAGGGLAREGPAAPPPGLQPEYQQHRAHVAFPQDALMLSAARDSGLHTPGCSSLHGPLCLSQYHEWKFQESRERRGRQPREGQLGVWSVGPARGGDAAGGDRRKPQPQQPPRGGAEGGGAEVIHIDQVKAVDEEQMAEIKSGVHGDSLLLFHHPSSLFSVQALAFLQVVAEKLDGNIWVGYIDCSREDRMSVCMKHHVQFVPDIRLFRALSPLGSGTSKFQWEKKPDLQTFSPQTLMEFVVNARFSRLIVQPEENISKLSKEKQSIMFVNKRPKPVSVYWLDFDGMERVYHYLDPEESVVTSSFEDHIWIIREKNGTPIEYFTVERQPYEKVQVISIEAAHGPPTDRLKKTEL